MPFENHPVVAPFSATGTPHNGSRGLIMANLGPHGALEKLNRTRLFICRAGIEADLHRLTQKVEAKVPGRWLWGGGSFLGYGECFWSWHLPCAVCSTSSDWHQPKSRTGCSSLSRETKRQPTAWKKHQKKPTLLIGHHLLEGKVAAIPKPMAIMRRTNPATRASTSGTGEMDVEETQLEESMDVDGSTGGEQAPPQWTIQGLVRKKIIFSKRPMPIITRA